MKPASFAATVNCGFARVAMKELKIATFRRLYQKPLHINDKYFLTKHGKKYPSKFETDRKKIKAAFLKKWHPQTNKDKYLKTFSVG